MDFIWGKDQRLQNNSPNKISQKQNNSFMRYGSVCSGIEAASVAWESLGWTPAWFSEIEPFPCAVLKHHYPAVPNLGDMTKINKEVLEQHGAINLLVGGTPCQSFSIAGLRKGMDDPRGNLALVFLGLVDKARPEWVVWENVPGVLSVDGGRALGSFLGGLAKLGYGWAYRILDAQYFGVPQRRRRIFVIGHLGDWRPSAAVLFERESLSGNPAPSRKKGEGPTPILEAGARTGKSTTDPRAGIGIGQPVDPMFTIQSGKQHAIANDTSPTIPSRRSAGGGLGTDFDCDGGLVAHSLRGEGFNASEDGTGRGIPLTASYLQERDAKGADSDTKPGHLIPVVYDMRGNGDGNIAPTLSRSAAGDRPNDFAPMVFTQNQSGDVLSSEGSPSLGTNSNASGRNMPKLHRGMSVRRLTPRECERLQGFPDDWTLVPYRNKPACDGPRYKAIGNSMAVPVMNWIGKRIQMVEDILRA